MITYYDVYRTIVVNGIATADSELVTMALYTDASEAATAQANSVLAIRDANADGMISDGEFAKGTPGGGGQNTASNVLLLDGQPPQNDKLDGTLYGPSPVASGSDLTSYMNAMSFNFPPVAASSVATDDPDQTPGSDPTGGGTICFAEGTLIQTAQGARPVEDLRPGDLLMTRDHGPQRLRWRGSSRLSPAQVARSARRAPVRIRAGALGPGVPQRDLIVSAQHRILLRNRVVQRMFGTDEVLIAAHRLSSRPGFDRPAIKAPLRLYHLLLDHHEILLAEGCETESLFSGPQAMDTLAPVSCANIRALLRLHTGRETHAGPARTLAEGRRARRLAERLFSYRRPLVDPSVAPLATKADSLPVH